ncbi:unnamed protein product [Rhizophagus irregularis]|uniref:Uncharacterized protein n=1 Tax=Rhizophagus irregularis TaxID=588596 RepID=A0A915ZT36_9GLOM|nr:hypothetical protein RIR_jg35461.t1 [Rhizophagus irregularis DAOM 181602=DAOM 197198]CAB5388805.1 unnamed protein product [Rhizophagus irregularis]
MLHSRSPIHDPLSRATPYSVRTEITELLLLLFFYSNFWPRRLLHQVAASCLIFKEPVGIVLQVETNRRVMVMM